MRSCWPKLRDTDLTLVPGTRSVRFVGYTEVIHVDGHGGVPYMNEVACRLIVALCLIALVPQGMVITQNLGAAPQTNIAVQGQTGAPPEGAS